jgi:TPR repeat protein
MICCATLPPATIFSIPIKDYAIAHVELAAEETDGLAGEDMDTYYSCCGKTICAGCIYSFRQSGNDDKCPFCNADQENKTIEENVEDNMKRAEANDAALICLLGNCYHHGSNGYQQDQTKAMELYTRAADLGCSKAHNFLGKLYHEGGYLKKAKFHYETAAMAGNEVARCNQGTVEYNSGNMERAIKHWKIAASAGHYTAMNHLRINFEKGCVSRELIESTLTAYNSSCAEMRSEARDAAIQILML